MSRKHAASSVFSESKQSSLPPIASASPLLCFCVLYKGQVGDC
uniref:Uncharacterized protein n=1 Tax=Rhizophora mucronata TaxID=61149 RepID=A0A2P2JWM6_RHIMU